jgi:hypothetical protein
VLLQGSGHVLVTDFDLSYSKGITKPRCEKVVSQQVRTARRLTPRRRPLGREAT